MAARKILKHLRTRQVLVDAHNVCYSDHGLRTRMLNDPESARQALEQRIGQRPRVLCFFDGGPMGQRGTRMRQGRYGHDSGGGREADDSIIQWLQAHPNTPACVVTHDRHLSDRAHALGAIIIRNNDFLEWITPEDKPVLGSHKPPLPDTNEVAFWLEAFGEDPPDETK